MCMHVCMTYTQDWISMTDHSLRNVSLRAELYDGAKLFYLSGLQYGCDAKNAFSTLK